MDRREFNSVWLSMLGVCLGLSATAARALSLSNLSQEEASQGLKAALEQGVKAAVTQLGQADGFLGNEKVRIPLPGYLNDAASLLRTLGQGQHLEELVTAMNRAAEAAVPQARDLLLGAVRSMNVSDAKNILGGGETSVTAFFAEKTRAALRQKFLPVVTRSTEKVGLADKYNQIAGKAADFGLVRRDDATIQQYVTGKALDGLYLVIGEEERKIRRDPVGTGSALLSKVFGVLK